MHVVVEDVGLVVVSFCIAGLASVALCGMTLILTFSAHETLVPSSSPAAAANLTCPLSNGVADYASPANPLLFVSAPQANDLGCCTHVSGRSQLLPPVRLPLQARPTRTRCWTAVVRPATTCSAYCRVRRATAVGPVVCGRWKDGMA